MLFLLGIKGTNDVLKFEGAVAEGTTTLVVEDPADTDNNRIHHFLIELPSQIITESDATLPNGTGRVILTESDGTTTITKVPIEFTSFFFRKSNLHYWYR